MDGPRAPHSAACKTMHLVEVEERQKTDPDDSLPKPFLYMSFSFVIAFRPDIFLVASSFFQNAFR